MGKFEEALRKANEQFACMRRGGKSRVVIEHDSNNHATIKTEWTSCGNKDCSNCKPK